MPVERLFYDLVENGGPCFTTANRRRSSSAFLARSRANWGGQSCANNTASLK